MGKWIKGTPRHSMVKKKVGRLTEERGLAFRCRRVLRRAVKESDGPTRLCAAAGKQQLTLGVLPGFLVFRFSGGGEITAPQGTEKCHRRPEKEFYTSSFLVCHSVRPWSHSVSPV